MNEQPINKKNPNEVGALWKKISTNGNEYMSGNIMLGGQEHKIVAFPNSYKKSDKHPDFIILLSKERNG